MINLNGRSIKTVPSSGQKELHSAAYVRYSEKPSSRAPLHNDTKDAKGSLSRMEGDVSVSSSNTTPYVRPFHEMISDLSSNDSIEDEVIKRTKLLSIKKPRKSRKHKRRKSRKERRRKSRKDKGIKDTLDLTLKSQVEADEAFPIIESSSVQVSDTNKAVVGVDKDSYSDVLTRSSRLRGKSKLRRLLRSKAFRSQLESLEILKVPAV
jgi:hypothetical protein